jgi:putative heme iron utilization protein
MAELTNLETKLGEVTGLAMAAQAATEKVLSLANKDGQTELEGRLQQMHDEAADTEQRCTRLSDSFEGKKTAILDEARTTKAKGAEMMKIYLDRDSDSLDGFEFLTMAEAR